MKAKNMLLIFTLTLFLGGTTIVKAAAVNFSVKADTLGDPHYTGYQTKKTDLNQVVKLSSSGGKTVKIALFTPSGNTTNKWTVTDTPTTRTFGAYTECLINYKYRVGVKLAYPWVQVTVKGSHDVK